MNSKSKQVWKIGETVKVGFLTLRVIGHNGFEYLLTNLKGDRSYKFTPYNGLVRTDEE